MHTQATLKITDAVKKAGGRSYFVGGCVRDSLMGIIPKDRDLLVTGLSIDQLKKILPGKIVLAGESFPVLKVTVDDETVDVALPRTEFSTGSGHTDFLIICDPNLKVEDDLARRDFTMNAIAFDHETGVYIDPFDGQIDINRKVLLTVGKAKERFYEDPLRILRGVRFAAKLKLRIDEDVLFAMKDCSHLIADLSSERIYDEMCRILMVDDQHSVTGAISCMYYNGILGHIIPEWHKSVGFHQNNKHHNLTVDTHVLKALGFAVVNNANLRTRWAVLLHDIAKPDCYTNDGTGGHFYGHEEESSKMASKILHRLKAPGDLISDVTKIIANHLSPQKDASDKSLRKFVAKMGDLTTDALLCKESDTYAHTDGVENSNLIRGFTARINKFSEIIGFNPAKLALKGDEIMAIFNVTGSKIGAFKKLATDAVIDGKIENTRESIINFLKEIK